MSVHRLLLVIRVFGSIVSIINCSTEIREEKVEKHSDQNMTFTCYADRVDGITWEFRGLGRRTTFQPINRGAAELNQEYSGVRINVQFSSRERRSHLIITKLEAEDTGHYRCMSAYTRQPLLNAYLTVLPPKYTDISETSSQWKLIVAVCVILPVVIAAAVAAIIFRHRLCKPKVSQGDASSNGRGTGVTVIDAFERPSNIRRQISSYLEVVETSYDSSGVPGYDDAQTGNQNKLPRVELAIRRYEDLHNETLESVKPSHNYKQLRRIAPAAPVAR